MVSFLFFSKMVLLISLDNLLRIWISLKDGFSKMIPISSEKNRCQAAKRSGAAAAKACKEAKKNLPQFPRIHWVSGWKICKSDPRYIDFSSSHEWENVETLRNQLHKSLKNGMPCMSKSKIGYIPEAPLVINCFKSLSKSRDVCHKSNCLPIPNRLPV